MSIAWIPYNSGITSGALGGLHASAGMDETRQESRQTIAQLERDVAALREELTYEAKLADLGALVSPLGHEINNYLNTILLQVAVLQQALPAGSHGLLAVLREQIGGLSSQVKRLHQQPQPARPQPRPIFVRPLLDEITSAIGGDAAISCKVDATLPAVLGNPADVRRLFGFLIRNAVAAAGPSGAIAVHATSAEASVHFAVEDNGPSLPEAACAELFGPGGSRERTNPLELAACKKIVSQLGGRLQCAGRPGGGLVVSVDLPRAAD